MKNKSKFNQQNLAHLHQYKHFTNECSSKPACKYGEECKSYLRSEQNIDQNSIKDQCHMKLYRHPPRTRQIKLAENMNSLIMNNIYWENHSLYAPTKEDDKKYSMQKDSCGTVMGSVNKRNGYLYALIEEVIKNGYGYD
eukprot:137388_1